VIGNLLKYVEDYSTAYTQHNESLLTLQAVYPTADVEAIVRNVKSVPILEKGIAKPDDDVHERTLIADEVLDEEDVAKDDIMTIPTRLLRIADGLLSQWLIAVSDGMVYTADELDDALRQIRPTPLTEIRRRACAHEKHSLTPLYRELEAIQMRSGGRVACNPSRADLVVDRAIENSGSKCRLISDRIRKTVLATGTEALRARYHAAQQVAPSGLPEQFDLFAGCDPLADVVVSPTTIQALCMFNEQTARVATLGIMVTKFANELQFRHNTYARLLIMAIRDAIDDRDKGMQL
jgi:hypothetical protein